MPLLILKLLTLYSIPFFAGFLSVKAMIINWHRKASLEFWIPCVVAFVSITPFLYNLSILALTQQKVTFQIKTIENPMRGSNNSRRGSQSGIYTPGKITTTEGKEYYFDDFGYYVFDLENDQNLQEGSYCNALSYGLPNNTYIAFESCEPLTKSNSSQE